MPRTAEELVTKHGKHSNQDDAAADGLFWRDGKWGATNKHGDIVDATGAFFDLENGSKIHVHVYKHRDSDLTIGHVKNSKGKKMQFKNDAGCKSEMRKAGFSEKQVLYVSRTLFPEWNSAPKPKVIALVPEEPTLEERQEAGRLAYHATQTRLRLHPLFAAYVEFYEVEPDSESDLLEFREFADAGGVDLDTLGGDASGNDA